MYGLNSTFLSFELLFFRLGVCIFWEDMYINIALTGIVLVTHFGCDPVLRV